MGGYSVNAQNKELKIGTNPTIKQPSAVLEVESANKGMLMPRVELDDVLDVTTIAAPANALTVFNTVTAGTAPNDVTPGYYYWSTAESKWIRLLNQNDAVEPWQVEGTANKATNNTQNIYQMGNVGIGTATPAGRLHVYADSFAATPIIEKATSSVPATNFGLGIVSVRHLANLTAASLAGYTGHGSWVGGGVTLGQNYSFKSGTDAQIDIAGISAGLIDYDNKKGQLNFFVNSGISGFKSAPLSGLNPPAMVLSTDGYLGLGTATANSSATYFPPTNKLHVITTGIENPVRFENLQASITPSTDKIVVADATGVLKTVPMLSMNNIYNANGSLTNNRTVTLAGNSLRFTSPERVIRFDPNGRIGSEAQGTNDADIYVSSGTGATYNRFDMQSFPSGEVNLTATGAGAQQMLIATHMTTNPAPLIFSTSPGGNVSGIERMRITGTGNVGIATPDDPSEQFDVGAGNIRIRDINANAGAGGDRIVVADVDGILKTIAAPTTTAIRTESANYAAADADETILVNAAGGTVTVTLPAVPTVGKKYNVKKLDSTANTVSVSGNGHNIDGTATISGTLPYQGWVMQYDGSNWFIISRI